MEIYIGADHNGLELKNDITKWLVDSGFIVHDVGAHELQEEDDYPDMAAEVGKKVAEDTENRRGILVCGSGVGMAVAANKIKGVRAALIHDPDIARTSGRDDNLNVVALGASYIAPNRAKEVVEAFLNSNFSGADRHVRRLEKIQALETSSS